MTNVTALLTIPVPIIAEKCPVWAQVEKKCTRDYIINNPKIIDLFSYKFYGGPHKGEFRIVNYNPRRIYCSLVPAIYLLYVNCVHKVFLQTPVYEV